MRKTSSIVEITSGRFDVVATGLSWADAMNQAMTLEFQVGGKFRQVDDGMTAAEYASRSRSYSPCPVQADWAFL